MTLNTLLTTESTTRPPTTPRLTCPTGWTEAENKCYKLFRSSEASKKLNWFEAESYCKKLNGNLASFTSSTSISTVLSANSIFSFNESSIWIGLNKVETGFEWTDGTPTNFFNWDFTQPTDSNDILNCVELKANSRWRYAFCYVNKDWMCSLPKGVNPNPDVIDPDSTIDSNLYTLHLVVRLFAPSISTSIKLI